MVTVTTVYYGADPGRRGRLRHHAAGGGDRPGERHRLHVLHQPVRRQHDHRQPAAELRRRQGADRDQHQDRLGAQPVARRHAAADADGAGRPDHRCDVYRLQFQGAAAQPDHRLSGARRAAEIAGGARRADRRAAGRQVFRPARLAGSGEARRAGPDRGRCFAGAGRQQLHLRRRHHQGPDGAGQPDRLDRPAHARRVPQPGGQTIGPGDRAAEGRGATSRWATTTTNRRSASTASARSISASRWRRAPICWMSSTACARCFRRSRRNCRRA